MISGFNFQVDIGPRTEWGKREWYFDTRNAGTVRFRMRDKRDGIVR
jgi:hypothetical protein